MELLFGGILRIDQRLSTVKLMSSWLTISNAANELTESELNRLTIKPTMSPKCKQYTLLSSFVLVESVFGAAS